MLEAEPAVTAPEIAPPPAADIETDAAPESVDTGTGGNDDSALDAELQAIYRKNNPEREANGRFRGQPKAEAAPETDIQTDQPPAAEPEQVKPAIQPPASWSAEEKAEWAALPPKAQETVLRREREATQLISRQGTELKSYEPLRSVIEQNRDVFERNGIAPHDGISRLLAAERMLETDPVSAITQLAQAYGVDLGKLSGPPVTGNASEAALHRRIADLERIISETSNRVQSREQQDMQQREQALQSIIAKFAEDKPEWPDLEQDVLAEITGLNANIDAGILEPMTPEQKLAKAWDRAIRNNPEAWDRMQAKKKAEEEAKRIAEAKKRVDMAARAKTVTGATNPQATRSTPDLDDQLRAIWRKNNPG